MNSKKGEKSHSGCQVTFFHLRQSNIDCHWSWRWKQNTDQEVDIGEISERTCIWSWCYLMGVLKIHFWFCNRTNSTSKLHFSLGLSFKTTELRGNSRGNSPIYRCCWLLKKIREFVFMECYMKVWGACWTRNITTIFIAFLLDKYFSKFHYCSKIFTSHNNNILVDVHNNNLNCFHFYFVLYFTAMTLIWCFCVCLLDTFQMACMYCIFVCAYYDL